MPSKKGFTLLELLIAVAVLFTVGTAIVRLVSATVSKLENDRRAAKLLLQASPMLLADLYHLKKGKVPLYRIFYFPKLRDDEIFELKRTVVPVRLGKPKQETLFENFNYYVWPLDLPVSAKRHLRFLRVLP